MPKPSESSQPANNSNGATPVHEVQQQIHYKHLGKPQLMRARFTPSPETYIISIEATRHDGKKVEVSRIYDELHPLMAVGRAVVEFSADYIGCRIDYINYKQKVLK